MGLKEMAERVVDALKPLSPETAEARRLLEQYYSEVKSSRSRYYDEKPSEYAAGRAILESNVDTQSRILGEIVEHGSAPYGSPFHTLKAQLLSRNLPLSLDDLTALLNWASSVNSYAGQWGQLVKKVRRYVEETGQLAPALEAGLNALREQALQYSTGENRKIVMQIDELLGNSSSDKPDSGEAWADQALSDLAAMPPEAQTAWSALFAHAITADGSKPNAKWLAEAMRHQQSVGEKEIFLHLAAWLNLVAPPPALTITAPKEPLAADLMTDPRAYDKFLKDNSEYGKAIEGIVNSISEKNILLLKGLAWYGSTGDAPDLARGLVHMTQAAFTSVVRYGTWATKAGNAGIWALGQMPNGVGVGLLARLRTRLRDRGALKLIAAAIESAAKAASMTVDELEDLAVPTGGLEANNTRRETFGAEGSALLTLDAATGQTRLQWFGPDGKPRKSVPAGVKREFAAEVKALKAAEEEIKQALTMQAARFDGFLLGERVWPLSVWRERYLSHPVLGNLTRRLAWTVGGVPSLPMGNSAEDVSGKTLEGLTDETLVSLWHPIHTTPETVMRWRDVLETRGIVQPFKQAHREIYLLTEAERNTRTYSNRFAAHILKQHQFNSLCVLRGWKNTLRLMVDDAHPPATRLLPQHGLRAEFWIEGIGDDYTIDTNEAGTYLRVATDQVRFYREEAPTNYAHAGGGGYAANFGHAPAAPLPLDQIPPLVFSEIMRDVDLFVGVASVGNDPAWSDGGPAGRYRDYWRDYAFGDLGETAKTRAEVLARLLPRLKMAARCRLDGRFLVVQGTLRTYKIHLGSGNILMEPNEHYLCIVPGRSDETSDLFLPFEGDRTLAIILSKALLLADDTAITDPTIVSQIKRQ